MEKLNAAKARTQKAENLAEKAGVKTAKHPLGTIALSKVKVKAYKESGIDNPVSWEGSKQFLRNEFTKISDKIANTRDEKLKEIMIELRDAIDNSKNDTERRKAIYEAALSAAPAEYKVKLKEAFNAFATFKFERQRTSE
jgi:tRNA(Phe) wybutosine-synthesizing methylase Tyw3